MKVKATCYAFGCAANGISKSFLLLKYGGHGTSNDGVECPTCHQVMRITRTVAAPSKRSPGYRISGRNPIERHKATRKKTGTRKPAIRKRLY